MAYTPIDKSTDYFNTSLWTGNAAEAGDGSTQAITGVGFQPDWIWLKKRSATGNHFLVDACRGITGTTKELRANITNVEADDSNFFSAIGSDGFTLGSSGSGNLNNATFVGFSWKANGAGSSNTDGTINTTKTSASAISGFSISTYTGTGSNATFGHGLGVAPDAVIIKNLAATEDWNVWIKSQTPKISILNETNAWYSPGAAGINGPTITSSVVGLGTSATANSSGVGYVAYCFANIQGFSKFESYKGNNANDGPMVHTGFKPAFLIIKRVDSTDDWKMITQKVEVHNTMNSSVKANTNAAEAAESDHAIDLLSNGFKLRENNAAFNAAGTYMYMAWASNPFVTSTGIPTTAL